MSGRWVSAGTALAWATEEQQQNGRSKVTVTRDGDTNALDVWIRSPLSVEFPTDPLAVTGTFWPATQAVSGSVAVSNFPAGFLVSGSVSVANFPSSQAVTGTFWQATQPVSGTFWPATQAVSGTFWQATQPVSIAATVNVAGTFWQATQPVSGPLTDAQLRATPVPVTGSFSSAPQPSTLCVTNTAAAAAACTLTLPLVAGQFHYLTSIKITRYATAAVTGTATPILVTSTNLPGNPVWTFARAQAIGTTDIQDIELAGNALRSAIAATATTIVCPATTSVLWRVTATYYAAT